MDSGMNTGEKSRFITQIELESSQKISTFVVENTSEPVEIQSVKIEKTPKVLELLQTWTESVSASHLTAYLYNPIGFYLNYVLKIRDLDDIEEQISQKNYGNLVHYSLQYLYENILDKVLKISDLENILTKTDEAISHSIKRLKHQEDLYAQGMNFIHKSLAKRVIEEIIRYDISLVKSGNKLIIKQMEKQVQAKFELSEGKYLNFNGFIDRIDSLNGKTRIIDFKTAKAKNLKIFNRNTKEDFSFTEPYKQAIQLCIYAYCVLKTENITSLQSGIFSFAEVGKGLQNLQISGEKNVNLINLSSPMETVKKIVLEILNPEIPFEEKSR
jgi:hypothetical protein